VCRRGCWPSVCEPGETAVSRAGCLPWADEEWLECRFSRPGRVGPGGGLGELEATAAEGMAAGVGCDVDAALGMAAMPVAVGGGWVGGLVQYSSGGGGGRFNGDGGARLRPRLHTPDVRRAGHKRRRAANSTAAPGRSVSPYSQGPFARDTAQRSVVGAWVEASASGGGGGGGVAAAVAWKRAWAWEGGGVAWRGEGGGVCARCRCSGR
jgi:hypothetical protein